MTETARLALPRIDAAQSQKHVTHNEALALLDALIQLCVLSAGLIVPPAAPAAGACYLVGTAARGNFEGHDHEVACFDEGAWRFLAPRTGWRAYVEDRAMIFIFENGRWVSLLTKIDALQNLALTGIGTTADETNPLSAKLNAVLFTARTAQEGGTGNLQFKLNRHQVGGTVSQLYQSNYSGRAETGLMGDDRFRIKVSPDGGAWKDALNVDPQTGRVFFPNGSTDQSPEAVQTTGTPAAFVLARGDVAPLPEGSLFWIIPHVPNATATPTAQPTLQVTGADAAPRQLRDFDGAGLPQGALEAGRPVMLRKAGDTYRVCGRRAASSWWNLLEDGGRFCGSPEPQGGTVATYTGPNYLVPANGGTLAFHSSVLMNSSSFGGAGAALHVNAAELASKIRAGASLTRGLEFHIALVTAGSQTTNGKIIQGIPYYQVFAPTRPSTKGLTLAHYMRVLTGAVILDPADTCPRVLIDGVQRDHVQDTAGRVFNAAAGWLHVQRWAANDSGVNWPCWPIRATPGTTFLIALPAVIPGLETLPWDIGPVVSLRAWR